MKRDTTSADDDSTSDIDDIVKRLTCTSDGCEVGYFISYSRILALFGYLRLSIKEPLIRSIFHHS